MSSSRKDLYRAVDDSGEVLSLLYQYVIADLVPQEVSNSTSHLKNKENDIVTNLDTEKNDEELVCVLDKVSTSQNVVVKKKRKSQRCVRDEGMIRCWNRFMDSDHQNVHDVPKFLRFSEKIKKMTFHIPGPLKEGQTLSKFYIGLNQNGNKLIFMLKFHPFENIEMDPAGMKIAEIIKVLYLMSKNRANQKKLNSAMIGGEMRCLGFRPGTDTGKSAGK